jgi:hypothetical protein
MYTRNPAAYGFYFVTNPKYSNFLDKLPPLVRPTGRNAPIGGAGFDL